jgi:hypothetical protein
MDLVDGLFMLIELLKEMGTVKRNQALCEKVMEFYRQKFKATFKKNPEQAGAYKEEFLWWMDQHTLMRKHLEIIHEKLDKLLKRRKRVVPPVSDCEVDCRGWKVDLRVGD